jgi:hypothetical protein
MLRLFESERFHIDRISPSDREALKDRREECDCIDTGVEGIFFGLANTGCKSSAAED